MLRERPADLQQVAMLSWWEHGAGPWLKIVVWLACVRVLTLPMSFLGRMTLRIRMMASGEEVCAIPLAEIDMLISASDHSTSALKRYLQSLIGVPRFRQRLVCEDRTVLEDAARFDTFAQLMMLSLPSASN